MDNKPGAIFLSACCTCFVGRPATRNTSWLFIVMLLFSLSFYLWIDGMYNSMFGAPFGGKFIKSTAHFQNVKL
jgi:hypothetical protein